MYDLMNYLSVDYHFAYVFPQNLPRLIISLSLSLHQPRNRTSSISTTKRYKRRSISKPFVHEFTLPINLRNRILREESHRSPMEQRVSNSRVLPLVPCLFRVSANLFANHQKVERTRKRNILPALFVVLLVLRWTV